MKFGVMFVNAGPFGEPKTLRHIAETAERCGFESLWTVEHVVVPVAMESKYPYASDGNLPAGNDAPLSDPIVALSFVAGLTRTIKLGTGILILPQRHPIYTAKEVASLDHLSGGRVLLGIGSGWLREEFDAVDVPFNERGSRTDEAIRALRLLWGDQPSSFDGKHYSWPAMWSRPLPVQRPGVPIIVGGHSPAAAKRAARLGDGFFPITSAREPESLPRLLAIMRAECELIARKPESIELTTGVFALDLDGAKRLQDLGFSRIGVPPPGFDEESITRGLETFANDIVVKLG
jgi:probable F420-dependent oxidoreductase